MKRAITAHLNQWKNNNHLKPLLIHGGRQVGKTHVIEEFGKTAFGSKFIKFDFERDFKLSKIFQGDLSMSEIIPQLEVYSEKSIIDCETLIFFDEIQECPNAIRALRYFYEERPKLHVIAAGSLLDFSLDEISFPVGRVKNLTVHPMTFNEFLEATGNMLLLNILSGPPRTLKAMEHEKALSEYKKYLLVGGLPEAVKIFAETGSYLKTHEVQRDLAKMYQDDFGKYAGRASIECLREVFVALSNKITSVIKYSDLSGEYGIPTVKHSVKLLTKAKIINKVYNTNPHGLPLGASSQKNLFKAVFLDIGIIHGLCGRIAPELLSHEYLLDAHQGNLGEQMIGQSLVASTDDEIFCWHRQERSSTAQVDFIIAKDGKILPVEVKSGNVAKLKSLHMFLDTYSKLAKTGYCFSLSPYEKISFDGREIVKLPAYWCAGPWWE